MGIIFCHQWHPQFGTWAVIVLIVWPLPHLFCVFCFFIFFFFISSPSLKHILHLHTHTCTHTACLCVGRENNGRAWCWCMQQHTHTHRHNSTRRTNSGNNSVIPSPHPSSFDLISPSHHCSPSSSPSTFIHFYPSILLSCSTHTIPYSPFVHSPTPYAFSRLYFAFLSILHLQFHLTFSSLLFFKPLFPHPISVPLLFHVFTHYFH